MTHTIRMLCIIISFNDTMQSEILVTFFFGFVKKSCWNGISSLILNLSLHALIVVFPEYVCLYRVFLSLWAKIFRVWQKKAKNVAFLVTIFLQMQLHGSFETKVQL